MCAFIKSVSVSLPPLAKTEEQNIIYPPTLSDWTKQMKQQLPDIGLQAYSTVIPEEKKQGEPYDYPSLLHGEVSRLWGRRRNLYRL